MYSCEYCLKQYEKISNGRNHSIRCKNNPNRIISKIDYTKRKNSNAFIKAKELGIEYKLSEETLIKLSKNGGCASTEEKEKERRRKLSIIAIKNEFGGKTSKKKINFQKKNGDIVHLQSSYEELMAIILEELDIDWSRPKPFIWVDDDNISHRYYPDFKINDLYIDTKNDYLAKIDLPKINKVKEQNNIKLIILTKEYITKEYIASLI